MRVQRGGKVQQKAKCARMGAERESGCQVFYLFSFQKATPLRKSKKQSAVTNMKKQRMF